MKRAHRSLAIIALWALGAWSAAAAASTLDQLVRVDLRLRYYRFNKLEDAPAEIDQRSSATGGMLDLESSPPWLGGFGFGVGLYGAWATQGFPAPREAELEPTLMGTGPRLTSVGEAYAQFKHQSEAGRWLLRAGRQLIDTPWLGRDDSRMLAQTFSGARVTYATSSGLKLTAIDLYEYKSRSSSGFTRDNLYYPKGYEGDPLPCRSFRAPRATRGCRPRPARSQRARSTKTRFSRTARLGHTPRSGITTFASSPGPSTSTGVHARGDSRAVGAVSRGAAHASERER